MAFFLIKLLSQETGIITEEICLTLYKIKLNDIFAKFGDEFEVSASNANAVFRRTLPILAHILAHILKQLSLTFKTVFKNKFTVIIPYSIQSSINNRLFRN